MPKKRIQTHKAPAAIGPYSQGIVAGNLVFVSGQLPAHPETGELVLDSIESATHQVMKNLSAVLQAGGSSLEQVVKITIFLKDMEDFAAMNQVYASYFTGIPPARSAVQAGRIPKDAPLEIEAIALT